MQMLWPNPSDRVCELIRQIAESQLPVSDEVADQLWRASQRETRQREYVDDPVLSGADWRLDKANMTHWLASNLQEPGRRVTPAKGSEMLIFARDLVLRGMDVNELGSWRAAQRVGWGLWVEECFAATTDRDELRELLEVSANSLTTYIDDSIAAVGPQQISRVSGRAIWMPPPHSAFWPGSDRRGRSSATRTYISSTCSRPT
ncbi:hypothetical protein ACIGHB_03090 [Streptomyces sp. NPDC085460]|uniref:hypothetical protein n=1 Tax=Streptomyces sp. NPDC085460 TaxID=3365723 RepID=UPI0037CE9465